MGQHLPAGCLQSQNFGAVDPQGADQILPVGPVHPLPAALGQGPGEGGPHQKRSWPHGPQAPNPRAATTAALWLATGNPRLLARSARTDGTRWSEFARPWCAGGVSSCGARRQARSNPRKTKRERVRIPHQHMASSDRSELCASVGRRPRRRNTVLGKVHLQSTKHLPANAVLPCGRTARMIAAPLKENVVYRLVFPHVAKGPLCRIRRRRLGQYRGPLAKTKLLARSLQRAACGGIIDARVI